MAELLFSVDADTTQPDTYRIKVSGGKAGINYNIKDRQSGTLTVSTGTQMTHLPYTSGYEGGTFRPENNITRSETAVMLYRLFTQTRVMAEPQENIYWDIFQIFCQLFDW